MPLRELFAHSPLQVGGGALAFLCRPRCPSLSEQPLRGALPGRVPCADPGVLGLESYPQGRGGSSDRQPVGAWGRPFEVELPCAPPQKEGETPLERKWTQIWVSLSLERLGDPSLSEPPPPFPYLHHGSLTPVGTLAQTPPCPQTPCRLFPLVRVKVPCSQGLPGGPRALMVAGKAVGMPPQSWRTYLVQLPALGTPPPTTPAGLKAARPAAPLLESVLTAPQVGGWPQPP